MPRRLATRFYFMLIVLVGVSFAFGEERLSFDIVGDQYRQEIRPLLDHFCLECHSTELKEGELDLERFVTLAEVRQAPDVWQNVRGMLSIGEMPPEDSDPLSAEQRNHLLEWLKRYLDLEARSRAGDPGPVVLRRLNNAQYTYTIRDLTGVELDPAREFPTDGAAGEGFTNTGQTLAMSPALVQKYLDAGKSVAAHAVLLPDGFRFSSHVTRRDWTDECIARIREFYRRFVDPDELGATYQDNNMTHLGQAGRLPIEKYLVATFKLRDDALAIENVARENGLSTRYLGALWSYLSGPEPSWFSDEFRARWRIAGPEDAAALAGEIVTWQKALWTFGPIGLIGTENGPARWMEPVQPIVTQHDVSFAIPVPGEGEEKSDVVVSLVVTDAGDGNEHDFVVWQQPRLIMEGQPDLLLRDLREAAGDSVPTESTEPVDDATQWGLDPAVFGKHPNGQPIDAASFCVQAPSVTTIRIPAEMAAGRTFLTTAIIDKESSGRGSVQVELAEGTPESRSGLRPIELAVEYSPKKQQFSDRRQITYLRPILVGQESVVRQRIESSFDAFRSLFPAALCYTQIVPVDEYLTITLFYREDDHLVRLILDDGQKVELDRLWDEFDYASHSAFMQFTALEMFLETTANSGADHSEYEAVEALLEPVTKKAETFKHLLIESEPRQLDALLEFASRAYRRPLIQEEGQSIRRLYQKLRGLGTPHEDAFRLSLARIFASPEFLYRLERRQPIVSADSEPARGASHAVSDLELASRLSYFLWSSLPDDLLRAAAESGRLASGNGRGSGADSSLIKIDSPNDTDSELLRQSRRMLKDARVRRLAIEFACQWLHIRDFDQLQEKSETQFPGFAALQADMYEESIRFFTEVFQNDGSVLEVIKAEHTFLNEHLAAHYGIPGITGPEWRRVDGVQKYLRGGILTQATVLARQSGASRTNPILRGNFVFETLLGQRMPRPPKDVPELPDDVPEGLTERALIEQHSSVEACAKCHARIDPYGFALEKFDAIGRFREEDSHGHEIDTNTTLVEGTKIEGLEGLQDHLLTARRDEFVRQFCRKLLGYSLGRGIQLSDEPLLVEMLQQLSKNNYRFSAAVDTIVQSDQFRMIRAAEE